MTIGFLTAKAAKLNFKQALCSCVESGNQNGTLAIHLTVVSPGIADFAIASVVYNLIMFFTPAAVIYIGNKKQPQDELYGLVEEEDIGMSTD